MKFAARDGSAARTLAYTDSGGFRARLASNMVPTKSAAASEVTPARGARATTDGHGEHATPGTQSTQWFAGGQEIFTPADGRGTVYIVRSGCVRLYKTLPDGRTITLGLLGPNTLFTQEEPLDGIASGSTAVALVDTTISMVQKDALAAIIAGSPELAAAVVTGMSRRLTELQTLVEHLLVRDTSVRLAATLLNLAERFGRPSADGMVAISLPLTHQALAQMIGSNRVTVTRKMHELQEGGYVRSLGRNAIAVNPPLLREYAAAGTAESATSAESLDSAETAA